ncbi:MAG: hypothetical protein COU65_03485 [Candidatus Pacebacteria bacterium CG10_big_fil_rev_8_21_14_0_10_42_12]|nr:MAG: hypothetical protein COU65_03485 [Candidatus Pacebacteria bacterium CG10_big_fil_rev_8_21_14_0_10_42_12]
MYSKERFPLKPISLIPEKVFEMAENRDNVQTLVEHNSANEIRLVVYEKDYPFKISSTEAWETWIDEVEKMGVKRYQKPAPQEIDRLHSRWHGLITEGKIALSDRIMLVCTLKLSAHNSEVLHVSQFDGIKDMGIATQFYMETLPNAVKNLGIHFITGLNSEQNIGFFVNKVGRARGVDIKPKFRKRFFPSHEPDSKYMDLLTVQFIYPVEKLIYCTENRHQQASYQPVAP